MKTEIWNGHPIRFVEYSGEWWAVAADITRALGLSQTTRALNAVDPENRTLTIIKGAETSIKPDIEVNIINELGIYEMIFVSRKKEALEFRKWVFKVLKTLRQKAGLEGFEVFRLMDKEHQKKAMDYLHDNKTDIDKRDYIKANTIANKAVSNLHGFPKMLGKGEMTKEMLRDRESILEDAVGLMAMNSRFGLDLSVSKAVYARYGM